MRTALRILGIVQQAFQPAQKGIYKPEKPVRDAQYRQFIKKLPCVACLKTWGVDPCHTGPHGTGQKVRGLSMITAILLLSVLIVVNAIAANRRHQEQCWNKERMARDLAVWLRSLEVR